MSDTPVYEPLFSRRVWEFDTDEIRLSAMSNSRFVAKIRDVFHFERAEIDRPTHQDRQRQPVWPPGLVFEMGVGPVNLQESVEEADEVAFRRLSIEADRVSIEVAGQTAYADQLMEYIRFLLSEMKTPEGKPFIGEPRQVKDFSLVVARHAGALMSELLPSPMIDLCKRTLVSEGDLMVLPEVSVRIGRTDTPAGIRHRPEWTIKPRFGVAPEKGTLESHAWLASDVHIALLEDLHASTVG